MTRNGRLIATALVLVAWLGAAASARATLPMQKAAKEAGFPVTNCLYCHGEKLPKKGAVTHNDRGKWLLAEKDERKAKEIDVQWLKDYKEPAAK